MGSLTERQIKAIAESEAQFRKMIEEYRRFRARFDDLWRAIKDN